MRVVVTTITFVFWAGLLLTTVALFVVAPLALIPLLVLAAGFEVVFALHVGVERIGRVIQTKYESGSDLPGWEHAAMKIGAASQAGGRTDPLFTWCFMLATALNLMAVLIVQTDPGALEEAIATLDGPPPWSFALFAAIHAAFIARLMAARRFARSQRERDLQLFS